MDRASLSARFVRTVFALRAEPQAQAVNRHFQGWMTIGDCGTSHPLTVVELAPEVA
jgi:hypothetical protein